jgi:23S rRNA pseudouridine1911/1915/1917 synthase
VPATERGWTITPEEFASWIVEDSPSLAVLNKPGCIVCHPSKNGPWSSLVGAAREYFGLETVHMPFRLDRETSGVWLAVKDRDLAGELQSAVERRECAKTYLAILEGGLQNPVEVNQPLGLAEGSLVRLRRAVRADGQLALTRFEPLGWRGGYTLAQVTPATGRLHQIRVHARWLGHPIAGDKLYGPDESLFLEFIERGFTGRVAQMLPLARQALHCESVRIETAAGPLCFRVPLADDLRQFWDSV